MRFTVIANSRSSHQLAHQQLLAAGLRAHGIEVEVAPEACAIRNKYVACWGWRRGQILRAAGHEVLVMERGYLGDRFAWTSLAWNGLNGRGDFGRIPDDSGERFSASFQMNPWKPGGQYAVIMGQVPGDASLQGRNMLPWYQTAAQLARDNYGMDVYFRPHPVALQRGHKQLPRGVPISKGSLEECLRGASVVITFNSNAAVDSVIAGVPAITCDEGSMAFPVSAHKIGELNTPDRAQWAHRLAWCQWSAEEISSGFALNGLLANRFEMSGSC